VGVLGAFDSSSKVHTASRVYRMDNSPSVWLRTGATETKRLGGGLSASRPPPLSNRFGCPAAHPNIACFATFGWRFSSAWDWEQTEADATLNLARPFGRRC